MPNQDDLLIASLSVKRRMVKPQQVSECLQLQADEEAAGQPRRDILRIFLEKGYLTGVQARELSDEHRRIHRKETPTLGPYEMLGLLGQGGMGTVHRARLKGTNIQVALKILPTQAIQNPDLVKRFKREAKSGGALCHPHIVRVMDFGEADGVHYITLELVEGGDLSQRLEGEGRLAVREALEIIRDVAKALKHSHAQNLIHRDIKPANIMFDRAGTVKLSDFGLVKSANPGASHLTQTGTVMGTPHYIAPEQAKVAKDADIRADIYSLGATLYHAVTGRTPFVGETPFEVVMKHLTEETIPPTQVVPDLPPAVSRLIMKMMAKEREDRHQTPDELIEDVERTLRNLQAGPAKPPPLSDTMTMPPRPGRGAGQRPHRKPAAGALADQQKLLIGGGAAGAVLLLLLAWWALSGDGRSAPANKGGSDNKKTAQAASKKDEGPAPVNPPPAATKDTPPVPPVVADPPPVQPAPVAPPANAAAWTDLLPRIDPGRDTVSGAWARQDGAMVGDASEEQRLPRLEVGPPPADEYDYEIEFTVAENPRQNWGAGEVCMIFKKGDLSARFALWAIDYRQIGFVWDFNSFNDIPGNATLTRQEGAMPNNRRFTARVEVRADEVRGYLDGALVSTWRLDDWETGYEMQGFPLRDPSQLGVGHYQSQVTYHAIRVRPHHRP